MRKNLAIGTLGIAVLLVVGLLSPTWWTATNGRARLNIGMLVAPLYRLVHGLLEGI